MTPEFEFPNSLIGPRAGGMIGRMLYRRGGLSQPLSHGLSQGS